MRKLSIVTLCNLLPGFLALIDIINEDIGDLHVHAKVGKLPLKYMPMSARDLEASDKVADLIDFVQLVPGLDPLSLPSLQPIGFDIPFLWYKGNVYMKNFKLVGVKQLQLNSAELRLANLRSDTNISIPNIYFEGDYRLESSLSIFPIRVSCHISANLRDLVLLTSGGAVVTHAPPTGDVLQVASTDIHVDIGNVMFNVTNITVGGDSGAEFLIPITQMFSGSTSEGNIFNGFLKTAIDMVNKELLQVPLPFFIDYLIPDGKL